MAAQLPGDAPSPWDLALSASEYALDASAYGINQRDASDAWQRLLLRRPLLYLPSRTPHGDCDGGPARADRGPRRRLWRRDELLAFDATVAQRTAALMEHQHAALRHWHNAATLLQAHACGMLARRRVARMRQQLLEAALAATRARELAAFHARQLRAAVRIQTVYRRHGADVRYVFLCRRRIHRAVRQFALRWQRLRAARVVQRVFRAFRRRVALAMALRTLLRLFRRSRQRAELEAATSAFQAARRAASERAVQQLWQQHPVEMAQATRVRARRAELQHDDAPLPRLPAPAPRTRHEKPRRKSHATRLPRLGSAQQPQYESTNQ